MIILRSIFISLCFCFFAFSSQASPRFLGSFFWDLSAGFDRIQVAAINTNQPNFPFLVAGQTAYFQKATKPNEAFVISLNSKGEKNPNFAKGGIFLLGLQGRVEIHGLGVFKNGDIVAAGHWENAKHEAYPLVFMLDRLGRLKKDFAKNGIWLAKDQKHLSIHDLLITEDQKILALGFTHQKKSKSFVLSLTRKGKLDAQFAKNGVLFYQKGSQTHFYGFTQLQKIKPKANPASLAKAYYVATGFFRHRTKKEECFLFSFDDLGKPVELFNGKDHLALVGMRGQDMCADVIEYQQTIWTSGFDSDLQQAFSSLYPVSVLKKTKQKSISFLEKNDHHQSIHALIAYQNTILLAGEAWPVEDYGQKIRPLVWLYDVQTKKTHLLDFIDAWGGYMGAARYKNIALLAGFSQKKLLISFYEF